MFKVSFDRQTGIVTLETGGFHSIATVEELTEGVARHVSQARRDFGRARILVLGQSLVAQAGDVMRRSEEVMAQFAQSELPGDRTAVVLASALSKLQAAKLFKSEHRRIFDSAEAATAWLLEEDGRVAAA